MENTPLDNDKHEEAECLAPDDRICGDSFSEEPETGIGALPPMNFLEGIFNAFSKHLLALAALPMIATAVLITADVVGRLFLNRPINGITDIESLLMSLVGFGAMPLVAVQRQPLQIELFYENFSGHTRRILYLLSCLLTGGITGMLGWLAFNEAMEWTRLTATLSIAEKPFVFWSAIGLGIVFIAFLFQVIHVLKAMLKRREYLEILCGTSIALLIASLPFLYKFFGLSLPSLVIGGGGFLLLLTLILLRVPLGYTMALIGLLGLLVISRRPSAAYGTVGSIPFTETTTFLMIALPMFMLMGDMVSLAGLSEDLFFAAERWLGRLPGGLAVATVGGCAGFGAVCGESLATVITMTAVALPAMKEHNYDMSLATGALAAGGTLGILIPPSTGFIIYSMITEESVGKLFVAGIVPGLLLTGIFMVIIMLRVMRNPSIAPIGPKYTLGEKLKSLVALIPVAALFLIVVYGILNGWFTPAEGGAFGAVLGFLYALVRRKLTPKIFWDAMKRSTAMFGKMFAMFIGLKVLGAFLAASRLPTVLAETVIKLQVSPAVVIIAIVVMYIILGCVMNIMPMMMLTLPSIYPTVQAYGFDGIWFGVLCVIVMEMGQITPPVGMNVYTLASLHPEISTKTIFKGVGAFFCGMLICIAIVACFPQLALCLL
ncbi:MAG: TRAP transporter large permease subunit [Mailhella sp.]|nr:TRAP transporter large permease subunit [Mailhella sp.]